MKEAIGFSVAPWGGWEGAPVDEGFTEGGYGVILLHGNASRRGAGWHGEARQEEGDKGEAGDGFHEGNS